MFNPDYATPPGWILEEYREESGLSKEEVAQALGITLESLSKLEDGELPIGPSLAEMLEYVTGFSEATWLKMEANYHSDLARLKLPPYDK